VIPLIVDGEPGNLEKECFPPALRFSVTPDGAITDAPVDLLAADLREKSDGIELALAKVVARLIGLSPDDVYRRADRERRRQARRTRRVQALIYALLVGIIGGLIGWINQAYLKERWNWFTIMRPYMLASVRPYVLTADTEHALKPFANFRECANDCPKMIVIPAGRYTMGSSVGEQGRYISSPQHAITIAEPLAVSEFDVTFADWDACVSVGGCPAVGDSGMGRGTTPAVNISWNEAQQYVMWLSKMTGRSYRLLTEAEWEYAARAGSTTAYYWGDEIGKENADCNGCGTKWDYIKASPVGSFKPNLFGLYDMAGDVWQWVQDCFHDDYIGAPADGSAWTAGDCSIHVVRGGAWYEFPPNLRSADRGKESSSERNYGVGFRVGRSLDTP
jgi:formylglycine-generating enzyme required for sulfatase activity